MPDQPAPPAPATETPIGRRGFLLGTGAAALVVATSGLPARRASARSAPRNPFGDYPFKLGVASGDPLPESVVLWTRLAPEPFAADGLAGMPPRNHPVHWEVAEDEHFRQIVRRGTEVARPALNHSVHAEVWGLQPGRPYFYRFKAGHEISPVGRTKTAPAPDALPASLRFAFASCSSWPAGFFTAYQHLATDDVDVVLHLGDYIYEHGLTENGARADTGSPDVRNVPLPGHFFPECTTLTRYRLQYSLYKSDEHLMAAHAAHPWIVTPDDHEIENNWAGLIPEESSETPPDVFPTRLAEGLQAYYENLPLRASSVPAGTRMQLFRRLSYGRLADFHVLDTRQYRDDQATSATNNEVRWDPNRSMLGAAQERWLLDGMAQSPATWNVVAQQIRIAEVDQIEGDGEQYGPDSWDGYAAARAGLLQQVHDRGVRNMVVVTGDQHSNIFGDLKPDFRDPASPVVGCEFVGTSVTSGGDGRDLGAAGLERLRENPHLKLYNNRRGYNRVEVTPDELRVDVLVLPSVTTPDAPIHTRGTAHVEAGRPGIAEFEDKTIV